MFCVWLVNIVQIIIQKQRLFRLSACKCIGTCSYHSVIQSFTMRFIRKVV